MSHALFYEPKSLSEFVWQDQNLKTLINGIVASRTPPNLLFHGRPGVGKSTLAKLIPDALENQTNTYRTEVNGSMDSGIEVIRNRIAPITRLSPSLGRHYIVIEEFDGMTLQAQKALKGVMDRARGSAMFIFTTNNISDVNEAILSRCKTSKLVAAPPDAWLPRAQHILQRENISYSVDDILTMIEQANGDCRRIVDNCLTASLYAPPARPVGPHTGATAA
ncbi:AAA family ATPase [Parvularcula sp. LCG005]|uniref:AAA family ATPase n=1 Tax=Parvularcula sp. LCG005 TaxID=3078805 RepID=UPI0029423818|nr:AAA family ATPase [Parvularcula sp. LCG005]WOI53032.1 AAA family ATPase [Parvularcula sp. LCG005]